VVTMGSGGSVLVTGDPPPLVVPAVPVRDGDPCGAGDRFAVSLAAALGSGRILADAVVAATQAASAHVAGASSPLPGGGGSVDAIGATGRAEVLGLVGRARARGMTVAVAGGCFDVLHAGHIALLAAASSLADVLVVVVNSDRSVRRLKGAGRPVVPEADRLAVLASLGVVHAVTVFDEATPVTVLEELQPDVFVKGGDYAHSPLAEETLLASWGGQAVVVPYLDGRSTTGLLRATGMSRAVTPAP
jgi:D-beta-D-heptose 7-phosphate kinase/D-beta-D-heptose 1-phosphate adenosyltransferase